MVTSLGKRDLGVRLSDGSTGNATSARRQRGAMSGTIRQSGMTLSVWTVAVGGLAASFSRISPDNVAFLRSPNARELIQRLGGAGPLSDALISAEFSILAAVVTVFGISVVRRAAGDEQTGRTSGDMAHGATRFVAVVAVSLLGTTWLLFVAGTMFAIGHSFGGGTVSVIHIAASLNHAPAVWTVVGLTILAWSFRPSWSGAGWGLLALFVSLGQLGELANAPRWLINFSPYARIALMPGEEFDLTSTVALTAGTCVLIATAAYNYARRNLE